MTLALMQPYFFPYIGYFELIASTERWLVFDTAQFSLQSWMYRNRILHPKEGWQYISLSLHKPSPRRSVGETSLKDPAESGAKLLRQLEHYRRKAPYYRQVCTLVEETFAETKTKCLVELNIRSLVFSCGYIGVPFPHEKLSELNLLLPPVTYPGQWPLEIATLLGAARYINASGGRSLFRPEDFRDRSIGLSFMPETDFRYECAPYVFQPHLSILDVLMWNSPQSVREHLFRVARKVKEALSVSEVAA